MESRWWLAGALIVAGLFITLQVWATRAVIDASRQASAQITEQLRDADESKLTQAKTREEILAIRLENERGVLFTTTFITNINAALAVLVALSGAVLGLQQYLGARRKERIERAGTELNTLWHGLADGDARVRAASIAGLQQFLDQERVEFYPRVVAGLAVVGRLPYSHPLVVTTFTRVLEAALRRLPTAVVCGVSWQGLHTRSASLGGLSLPSIDLRDADLRECDLMASDLRNARLDASQLNWTKLDGANLSNACLRYADLAGASLCDANLSGADLRDAKILGADLRGADLRGASFDLDVIDWSLSRNWRQAKMDAAIRKDLIERYGPDVSGQRVLMLTWEYPPFTSGGGWTAVFHLARCMRQLGVDLTLMVPWKEGELTRKALGYEYPLLCCGIELLGEVAEARKGTYEAPTGYSVYGPSLSKLVMEFESRALRVAREGGRRFDVIHAHDWLTFGAAQRLSTALDAPWVGQFHSLEEERRSDRPSRIIQRVERGAAHRAQAVATVGRATRARLAGIHEIEASKVTVIPNCWSHGAADFNRVSNFDAQKVIFVGRLTAQKGPDHFVRICQSLRKLSGTAHFAMYGDGDMLMELCAMIDPHTAMPLVKEGSWWLREVSVAEPITVDPTTGEWRRTYPVTGKVLADALQGDPKIMFTIYPLSITTPYTHFVEAAGKDERIIGTYLIRTNSVPNYPMWPGRLVDILGPLPWERRMEAYEGATAVIMPSRMEPFGFVVLEAMQSGVPVFYAKDAGVADVIDAGVRIDPDDHDGAAHLINEVLSDHKRWEQIVEEQMEALASYRSRRREKDLVDLWSGLGARSTAVLTDANRQVAQ